MRKTNLFMVFTLVLVSVSLLFMGTTTTRTSTQGKVEDFKWVKWNSVTLAASTDTAIFTFPSPPDYPQKSTLYDTCFQVTVSTQTVNGDSVELAVRFESSYDNSNWEIFTVGTDSTSWLSTAAATAWDPHATRFLSFAAYGGKKPYNRFRIFGRDAGNLAGTKVKVDVVGFD